jgi:hypothetical protein
VKYNNFIENSNGNTQAGDEGLGNTFSRNYWSDWTSPDNDKDNIVDMAYKINGDANNYDLYPLTEPYHQVPVDISSDETSSTSFTDASSETETTSEPDPIISTTTDTDESSDGFLVSIGIIEVVPYILVSTIILSSIQRKK